MNAEARADKKVSWQWLLVFLVVMLLSLSCLGLSLYSAGILGDLGNQLLGVNLHSLLVANYNMDPLGMQFSPVGLALLGDALRDQLGEQFNPDDLATLTAKLKTPVASITPNGFEKTPTLAVTATPVPNMSRTPTRVQSPTPTKTPTQTSETVFPTSTLIDYSSATPTRREQEPTDRPATHTQEPPTREPPTEVPTAPPTRTPVPTKPPAPTATSHVYPPPYP